MTNDSKTRIPGYRRIAWIRSPRTRQLPEKQWPVTRNWTIREPNDVNRTRAVIVCLFSSFSFICRLYQLRPSSESPQHSDIASVDAYWCWRRRPICRRVLEKPFKSQLLLLPLLAAYRRSGSEGCDDAAHSNTIGIAPGGAIQIDLDFGTRCTCEHMINVEHAVIHFFSFFLLFFFLSIIRLVKLDSSAHVCMWLWLSCLSRIIVHVLSAGKPVSALVDVR